MKKNNQNKITKNKMNLILIIFAVELLGMHL